MQILQVIKRQSTVRTLQEIYSYWKGNKCLTWNGYNEKFDSVSQQEILSLKTSTVSILPSSFENCHSDPFPPTHFSLFSFCPFFNPENLGSWGELFSLSPSAAANRVPSIFPLPFSCCCWEIPWFGENCLSSAPFPRHVPWHEHAHRLLSYRQWCPHPEVSLPNWNNSLPGPPLLSQVTGSLSQQLQSGLKERVQSWCILAGN